MISLAIISRVVECVPRPETPAELFGAKKESPPLVCESVTVRDSVYPIDGFSPCCERGKGSCCMSGVWRVKGRADEEWHPLTPLTLPSPATS